jgi:hypothetical protein
MRLALVLGLLLQEPPRSFDPAVHEATQTFAFQDFLIIPVRIHILHCETEPMLHSGLEEKDIRRIFEKVNRIWNRAGLAMMVEDILTESTARPEGFDGARPDMIDFKKARPKKSLELGMIHVFYVHELPTNGVYLGSDAIFVKDTALLRPARGGTDEPIPRVTSHEIGHALGLPHRQNTINLMASGTSGWSLSDAEIDVVRAWAKRQTWILTPAAAFERKRYAVLASLPGDSELKEKAKKALEN